MRPRGGGCAGSKPSNEDPVHPANAAVEAPAAAAADVQLEEPGLHALEKELDAMKAERDVAVTDAAQLRSQLAVLRANAAREVTVQPPPAATAALAQATTSPIVTGSPASDASIKSMLDTVNMRLQVSSGLSDDEIIAVSTQLGELYEASKAVASERLDKAGTAVSVAQGVALAAQSGIVAVGSRLAKFNITEEMQRWAGSNSVGLPKAIALQSNTAAVQEIGPRYAGLQHEQEQLEELRASLAQVPKDANVFTKTKLELRVSQAEEGTRKAQEALDKAYAHLQATRLESAATITPGLARDANAYSDEMRKMAAEEVGVLDEITAAAANMVNHGALKEGEDVEVVSEGKMQRAKVRRVVDEAAGTYELSLWTVVNFTTRKYEEGFDTSEAKLLTVPRKAVYANKKHKQRLSSAALALASERATNDKSAIATPPSISVVFLALLYSDAESTLPHMHDLGDEVEKQMPGVKALAAPLKGEARACYKSLDKYNNDYSRLTDIARMTFKCSTLKEAHAVLLLLGSTGGWRILLIKNRLMLEFDASASGGYRDMLLNVYCEATGHIVEVQITLDPLIAVKMGGVGGGHANYGIARTHDFFEKSTYRHEGALTPKVLEKVRCGIMRELACNGKTVGLTMHFDALLAALRSPSCVLSELRLLGCDWPEGRKLSELIDALPPTGLRTLNIEDMPEAGCVLPAALFDKCSEVELLDLCCMGLTGPIPASIGKLTKVTTIYLWGNKLEGSIPDEIGKCVKVHILELQKNQLSGPIPESIGQCVQMQTLLLYTNQLSGPIPESIGKCVKLQQLILLQNQLSGPIPESIGQCIQLQKVNLHTMQLSGTVPQSLAGCTALTELHLNVNPSLTITEATKKAIEQANPKAKFYWPPVT